MNYAASNLKLRLPGENISTFISILPPFSKLIYLAVSAVKTVFAKKSTGKNILFVLCAGFQ